MAAVVKLHSKHTGNILLGLGKILLLGKRPEQQQFIKINKKELLLSAQSYRRFALNFFNLQKILIDYGNYFKRNTSSFGLLRII